MNEAFVPKSVTKILELRGTRQGLRDNPLEKEGKGCWRGNLDPVNTRDSPQGVL